MTSPGSRVIPAEIWAISSGTPVIICERTAPGPREKSSPTSCSPSRSGALPVAASSSTATNPSPTATCREAFLASPRYSAASLTGGSPLGCESSSSCSGADMEYRAEHAQQSARGDRAGVVLGDARDVGGSGRHLGSRLRRCGMPGRTCYQETMLPRPPRRSEMRLAAAITSLPSCSSSASSSCGR